MADILQPNHPKRFVTDEASSGKRFRLQSSIITDKLIIKPQIARCGTSDFYAFGNIGRINKIMNLSVACHQAAQPPPETIIILATEERQMFHQKCQQLCQSSAKPYYQPFWKRLITCHQEIWPDVQESRRPIRDISE